MANNNTQPQEFFELWKKQMEEGAQMWSRMVGQATPATPTHPDPLSLWRPFMEQATATWASTMKAGAQPTGPSEMASQGKALMDQWISAWDRLLADTMQTDAFAQAMGKYLDQWLSTQGPARKAAAEQTESTLQALGMPSRNQVIGIARQLMDLDDRIEDIENNIAALRAQLDQVLQPRAGSRRGKAEDQTKAAETP